MIKKERKTPKVEKELTEVEKLKLEVEQATMDNMSTMEALADVYEFMLGGM